MKKYLVVGNPIEHSLSPKLHNYWIKKKNLKAIYEKIKLKEDDIEKIILDIRQKKISGINVTVPFKKKIIPYLDELSTEAKQTQSVNTVLLKDNRVYGYNTDIDGFYIAIKKINFDLTNKRIFILGAGGVVPSIIFALNKIGVSDIIISNRSMEKAKNLKKMFKNIKIINWGQIPQFDVIINATSIGLNQNDRIKLNLSNIGTNKLFYDLIYNPKETNFLKIGKELGNKTENGELMFIYQALVAFKLWHGIKPEINGQTIEILNQCL